MKKNYLIAILVFITSFVSAQIEQTSYRGAFAPAPTAMWTDSWTNFDPRNEPYLDAATVVNVTADITTNTTWTTGKTYKLNSLIYVRNNATLTIQPGVIVKGISSATGTALIITKGAKLNAIGTATSPVVFTSNKTVAEGRQPGDWGGIVLLGKAGVNVNNGLNNIEGIAANVNTEYGGGLSPINNDNSGTLKYVRIEFAGYVFSPNNEINGLTMGGVGNGTTIDYVQVSFVNDDGFEWFGGSVNCKHLVSFRSLDDDFDTDNGYKGFVQFALGIKDPTLADAPSVSTSEGFESDNNTAGVTSPVGIDNTTAIFTNVTLIGPAVRATTAPTSSVAAGHERPLRLRRATQLKVYNSIFMDFKNNFVFVDGTTAVANANANPATLKFKNNIIAGTINPSFTGGVNPTSLNTWFTTNGNSIQSSSTGLLTTPYLPNTYVGSDYRPGGIALTGADFTDSSIAPLVVAVVGSTPVVANLTYCKSVIAPALTATLTTTGVSLRWYTVATGGTFTTAAPIPLTTTVGSKTFYVSQVDAANVESARVPLIVTILASPTEVIGTITGTGPVGSTSAIAVGRYVGTTSTFTYTVPAFIDPALTYFWTVPNGVNIVSGQGTNTLTVNYANVPAGAGSVGSIQIQAENTAGCRTLAKSLAITKALPTAPAKLSMFNRNLGFPTPLVAITNYGAYMGTTTPLTLVAGTVLDASSYQWELPTGVSVDIPASVVPVTTSVTYSVEPFLTPGSVPAAVGTKFWVVTFNEYSYSVNGVPTVVTTSTAVQRIFGTAAYGGISAPQPYLQYGTVVTSNLPSILINFANVTNPSTTALYFGVRSRNGVGSSVTLNTTNADVVALANIPGLFNTSYSEVYTFAVPPSTNATSVYSVASTTVVKTSKLLKLTAALPAAPSALKLTNNAVSTSTAVTIVTPFIGTTTPLTLTATPSPTASSYAWELPAGVNQISGGNSNVITINFANVAPGVTSFYLGAKAVNGIGSSITSNATAVPATSSTAKLLKVTATLPAAPTTLVLTNPAINTTAIINAGLYLGTTTPLTLTASVSLLATSYSWELPAGVTQLSGGNSNVITVNLAGVAPGTVTLYFGVKAVNAVGSSITLNTTAVPATSSTAKLLKVTNTVPAAITVVTGQIVSICGGSSYSYVITPSALASSYVITAPIGSVVTSASNASNSSNVLATSDLTFSVLYPSNFATLATKTLLIASVNGFGTSLTSKSTTLSALLPTIGVATGSNGITSFTRCATQTLSIPAVIGGSTYTWLVANGATIVSGQGTTTVTIDFSAVPNATTSTLVKVTASTSCGTLGTAKSITLASVVCPPSLVESTEVALDLKATTEVYPNPAISDFNVELESSRNANVVMEIYSFEGVMVSNAKSINLEVGKNTVNENISNLKSGIYFIKFINTTNNEVIVKKLIKK